MLKNLISRYPAIGQFIRFGTIGVMNTGIDLIVLNILMLVFAATDGTPYTVFKALSFTIAATFSYFFNKYWTFRDKSKQAEVKKFSQFFLISIVGALINIGTATLVVNLIKPAMDFGLFVSISDQLWGNIGALCGTAVGLIWNFLGYKFIVFKK